METKISAKRLKELERIEAKLLALEAGGVDNWEGYDFALEDYRKENEIDELIEDFIEGVQDAMIDGVNVDIPSVTEAGYSVTINDRGESDIVKLVKELIEKVEEVNMK